MIGAVALLVRVVIVRDEHSALVAVGPEDYVDPRCHRSQGEAHFFGYHWEGTLAGATATRVCVKCDSTPLTLTFVPHRPYTPGNDVVARVAHLRAVRTLTHQLTPHR